MHIDPFGVAVESLPNTWGVESWPCSMRCVPSGSPRNGRNGAARNGKNASEPMSWIGRSMNWPNMPKPLPATP
jgi:hypothetical protein